MITKFFIAAGFVLAIIAAGGSFSIYQSYQSEREQRLDAESKFMQAQDAAAAMKADMEQQKSRIADLEAKIEFLKKEGQQFKSQQLAKDSELQSLSDDIAAKNEEILKLHGRIENFKQKEGVLAQDMRTNAAVSSVAAAAPASFLPAQDGSATSVMPATTAIAVGSSSVIPAEAAASDDSRILTVNRKFNFIVVNLGLRDGLKMGDKIQVMQGSNQKALAQIEKIYDKFSAATLLDEDKGNPVHEGDSIRKG